MDSKTVKLSCLTIWELENAYFQKKWSIPLRDRLTKQGKLAQERNSKIVPVGMEISAGDLLTTCTLKNNRCNITFP